MSKNLTKEEWLKVIKIYLELGASEASNEYLKIKDKPLSKKYLKLRIRYKLNLLDNKGMEILKRRPGSGRPRNKIESDIQGIIDDLTEENKREIIKQWIREQKEKENNDKLSSLTTLKKSLKARILDLHRTTMYKKPTIRKYKFDFLKNRALEIFNSSRGIYGSRKIVTILLNEGKVISDRTLRNYMVRWGIFTLTRKKKRRSESKNTNVKFNYLVTRNYNPLKDNIVATDVSYIPANVLQNNIYLSAAISHKTKKIESWKLSKINDSKLVIDTIEELKTKKFILHFDHGSQYSSNEVQEKLKKINAKTPMGRVGNSLDNREIEYFFGCLKGEYLNHINTSSMNYDEVYNHISWYINWYNSSRIQKKWTEKHQLSPVLSVLKM